MAGFVESLYNKSICKKQERRRMNWKNVQIVPTFVDQGVSCYQLEGGDLFAPHAFEPQRQQNLSKMKDGMSGLEN